MASWSSKSKYGSILSRKFLANATPRSSVTARSSASSLFKTVCLHDWWLVKPPEGKEGLAVSGLSSREGKAIRAFKSDVIARRHDANTLETVDGFSITLVGYVNKHLTHQNGFSPEVCSNFQFGFPYDWEEYNVKDSNEVLHIHSSNLAKDTFKTRSCNQKKEYKPESSDDLPLTRNRDPLMYNHKESDCHMLTTKAIDDLFECISEMEENQNSFSPDATCGNLSDAVKMASRPINSNSADMDFLTNGPQSETFDGPPGPKNLGHNGKSLESGHVPLKRKICDMEVTIASLLRERINSDSAASKKNASAGNKPAVSRRITRNMSKKKN